MNPQLKLVFISVKKFCRRALLTNIKLFSNSRLCDTFLNTLHIFQTRMPRLRREPLRETYKTNLSPDFPAHLHQMMALKCVQVFFKSTSLTRLGEESKLMIQSMETISKTTEISFFTGYKMPGYDNVSVCLLEQADRKRA